MSSNPAADAVQGITETDIANYLAATPGFFERHAALLASVQLQHPHGARAVSLQERQAEMLRDKIKGLEQRLIEMIRNGQDNVAIADRLHRWTRAMLLATDPAELPATLVQQLKFEFLIPQAALRLWGVADAFADEPFAQPCSDNIRSFSASLALPYCGVNSGFEAIGWLDDAKTVQSTALIPLRLRGGDALRAGMDDGTFGLLVLGSPDPTRYSADMGTEFLIRVGEIASAGLSRLLPLD